MADKNFRKGWLQNMLIQDRSGNYQRINRQGCYCIESTPIIDEREDGTPFARILLGLYVSKNAFKQRVRPLNQSPFVYEITDSIPATDGISDGLYTQYFGSGDIWTNSISLLGTLDGSESWHINRLINLTPYNASTNPNGAQDA